MAQTFSQFSENEYVKDAPAKLNNNFSAVASQFAGTAFPNTNLVEGMVCYRTDTGSLYRYINGSWVLDTSGGGSPDALTTAEVAAIFAEAVGITNAETTGY